MIGKTISGDAPRQVIEHSLDVTFEVANEFTNRPER
jgi:hypothetical protein